MFSGIIGYRGRVVSCEPRAGGGAALRVRCEGVRERQPAEKDSIGVDGICLTVTALEGDVIAFDVIPETLARTTLGDRAPGDTVNIEYAIRAGEPLGGHFVYGHVDATARVLSRTSEGQGERMRIELPPALRPMIAEKAFVAIDGASLTVAAAAGDWFEIALIPETLARTTLGSRSPGDRVNVEADPIARYVHHVILSLSKKMSF